MTDHVVKPPLYTCPVCGLGVDTPGWRCVHDTGGQAMSETTELSGSALAGAVAIKVMGWTLVGIVWFDDTHAVESMRTYRPYENIAQAWEVKDRMIALGYDFDYEEEPLHGERPCAGFIKDWGKSWYEQDANGCVAICRAALAAIEAKP